MKARILSIDGGGIRGVAALRQLISLRTAIGKPLHEYFTYISGTSTGSIIAGLLSIGMEPYDILDLYTEHGDKIFKKEFLRFGIFQSKYSDKYLNEVLEDYTKCSFLKDSKTRLIIPAYNATKREIKIFKSYKESENYKLFDVIRASSAAPTFFDPWEIEGDTYVDGGLVSNNPAMISTIEALKDGYKEIHVISFSTGIVEKPIPKKKADNGVAGMASPTIDILLAEQSQMTDYTLDKLFNLPVLRGSYTRCETYITNSNGKMDDASKENMMNMIQDGVQSAYINKRKFLDYVYKSSVQNLSK